MKSHVTIEQKACVVCGRTYDTDSILLDTKMRERFERETVTGWGVCEEHQKVLDDGYVILVACNGNPQGDALKPEEADRTGALCYVRAEVAMRVFNVELQPVNFCEPEVVEALSHIAEEAQA